MKRLKLLSIISLILFSGTALGNAWYEGGTLPDKGALIWQEASFANKVASSSDLVAALYQENMLTEAISKKIKMVDDFALYAIQLAICIDSAAMKEADPKKNIEKYTDQTVSGIAALCVIKMGWGN